VLQSVKNGRYLLLSLLIHALILCGLSPIKGCGGGGESRQKSRQNGGKDSGKEEKKNGKDGDNLEILPKIIEVTMVERPAPEKGSQPKPPKDARPRSKTGYWGIGVYQGGLFASEMVNYHGIMYFGWKIVTAVPGNPAARAGLQTGDIVFLVDNMPLSVKNDVKGDGPRAMILTVKRGNYYFELPIERGWIETNVKGDLTPAGARP
jgi:hypothetical protein